MASKWQEAQLTDLYDISSGLSKPAKDFGSGYPFLAFKDVFNNFFVPSELTQSVQSNEQEQKKCSVRRGDVFLTRTSETMHELGMSSVALKDYDKATFNGFTKRLRPKDDNILAPEFVGYFLRSPRFRNEMLAFSTMSTRASLNNQMISLLKISFPPLPEQKAIAHVLGALDDRIALNRRMNETLESMAQTLFKSWFVDFDPVIDNALASGKEIPEELSDRAEARIALGDKRQPLPEEIRTLFPDEFVESDELGWIPKGWEVKSIYDLVDVVYGAPFKSKEFNSEQVGTPIIRIRDLKTGVPQCWSAEKHPKRTEINPGDVVVGMDAEFRATIWPGRRGFLNQRLFTAVPKLAHLNSFFIQMALTPHLAIEENAQVGTTVAHLGKKDIDKFTLLKPPRAILEFFSKQTDPLLSRWVLAKMQIVELAKLRDTLLPKLLSGEVRIPEVEKMVEELAL